jgi:DNA mismatch repair protein MutL
MIQTYGFRGEALHSIAKVSRLEIKSRHYTQSYGAKIITEGGRILNLERIPHPVGTTVEVWDLFFNVPVRYKFLKKTSSEKRKITEKVITYALAFPKVAFKLEHDGKKILELLPTTEEERIKEIFNLEETLIEAFAEEELLKAKLYYFPNFKTKKHYVFLNSRPIYNKEILRYLKNKLGFKSLAVLFLEVPPYLIDVNIHPKKEEVKFYQERKILSLIGKLFENKRKITPLNILFSRNKDFQNIAKNSIPSLAQTIEIDYLKEIEAPPYKGNELEKFEILGQIEETIIVAYRKEFIYFFDQHLLDEVVKYHLLKEEEKACKKSIKAGEKLSKKEMEELVKQWQALGEPEVCPHGRPVYYRIFVGEIYKKLGRS